MVRANESDGELILVVTSDGNNEEAVSVEYAYTSGTAQGNELFILQEPYIISFSGPRY